MARIRPSKNITVVSQLFMQDFVLNGEQKKIIKSARFLKEHAIYLAGGTALALHLGHRTSQDLDFYTKKHFKPRIIYKKFKKVFSNKEFSKPIIAEDTLKFKIGNTDLSFFRYPYPLIRPLISFQSVELASPEDIAAMKMEAILDRGLKRDFIDIYFLIKKYGLKEVLIFVEEKYPETFNEYRYLIAVTYFEDAEKSEQGRKRIYVYSGVSWTTVKRFLSGEVKKHQFSLLTPH